MPGDPIVNDHYGDVLWKMVKKFSKILLELCFNLEETEDKLKKSIEVKLIKGI